MPKRENALVTCSCGAKWGDRRKAEEFEEMQDLEHAMVASRVPLFLRHWRMQHQLTGHGGRPLRDLIEKAARDLAEENS